MAGQSGLQLEGDGSTILVDPWLAPHPERARLPVRLERWPEACGCLGTMSATEAAAFCVAMGASTLAPLHHDGVIGNICDPGDTARAVKGQPLHRLMPARARPFCFGGSRR